MSLAASLSDVLPTAAVSGDGDRWPWLAGPREAVVFPSSTDEVAATMRWAAERQVGVAVVASGQRFRARRLERPFLILCTDRLVGTEVYEPADLTLTARAGTPVRSLAAELAAERQWLPYDPPHVEGRSLGGLVATGESGSFWMGYGELRNHVLGATVVKGDGTVLRLGGRVVKNVAGFDLLKAIVGSRGRLGVMTSVCVRAFPVPPTERLLRFTGEPAARLLAIARAVGTAPLLPVSSVLVSEAASTDGGAALLVRLHGAQPTVDADHRTLDRHCGVAFEHVRDGGAVSRSARDLAADAELVLRIATLPSRVSEALDALRATVGEVPFAIDTYGGTIRAALSADRAPVATKLRSRIEALGGLVSASSTNAALDVASIASPPSSAAVELTARLEAVFDPRGVLWPCRA
jgi:glycolate oxidase FAD binding subunit